MLSLAFSQTVQNQNEAVGLRQTEQLCAPGKFGSQKASWSLSS